MMSILNTSERMSPIHPGAMLREEFMVPLGLTSEALAQSLGAPVACVEQIVAEQAGISGEMALRFKQYFRTSAGFWMNMQKSYELGIVSEETVREIERTIIPAPRDPETGELIPAAMQSDHA